MVFAVGCCTGDPFLSGLSGERGTAKEASRAHSSNRDIDGSQSKAESTFVQDAVIDWKESGTRFAALILIFY